MKVKFNDVRKLNRILSTAEKIVPDRFNMVSDRIMDDTYEYMKERAPKPGGSVYGPNPYATGELLEGIKKEGRRGETEIISEAPHSGHVNYGTERTDAQPFFTDSVEYMKDQPIIKIPKEIDKVFRGLFKWFLKLK